MVPEPWHNILSFWHFFACRLSYLHTRFYSPHEITGRDFMFLTLAYVFLNLDMRGLWWPHQDSVADTCIFSNKYFFSNNFIQNPSGATINLACWDMRQFEFLTLSRISLKLHTCTYEVLQPSRDNRGEILCSQPSPMFS